MSWFSRLFGKTSEQPSQPDNLVREDMIRSDMETMRQEILRNVVLKYDQQKKAINTLQHDLVDISRRVKDIETSQTDSPAILSKYQHESTRPQSEMSKPPVREQQAWADRQPTPNPAAVPNQLLEMLERAIASRASEQDWQEALKTLRFETRTIVPTPNALEKEWAECESSSGAVTLVLNPGTDQGWALPYPDSRIQGGGTGQLFNFSGSTRATEHVVRSLPVLERTPSGAWTLLQAGTLAEGV